MLLLENNKIQVTDFSGALGKATVVSVVNECQYEILYCLGNREYNV